MNYYNEIDPYAAQWLRNLIAAEIIPTGHVDTRSIAEVTPHDLHSYTQCHFFAGVGGWPYALRLIDWPTDSPVWTGSCPCQPFSVAGLQLGTSDPRHLWPEFYRLISQCGPSVVFGEQVAGKAGREWLSGVRIDLEEVGYEVGAADLCAAGVGSPHIRQRLYWVADTGCLDSSRWGDLGNLVNTSGDTKEKTQQRKWVRDTSNYGGVDVYRVDNSPNSRRTGNGISLPAPTPWQQARLPEPTGRSTPNSWSHFDIIPCKDSTYRRVESGTFPLAHGVPGRVGMLRAYGNAIVPELAAEFIQAWIETLDMR